MPLNKIVVIDESAASTKLARLCGRCGKGERLVASVPHGYWKVLTMIAAMSVGGVRTAVTVDAATDGEIFLRFVTDALVPTLVPGDVVVMDNLQAHKVTGCGRRSSGRVRGCCTCRRTARTSRRSSRCGRR